jgi:hypothetical protein
MRKMMSRYSLEKRGNVSLLSIKRRVLNIPRTFRTAGDIVTRINLGHEVMHVIE